ncbi:MAG: hypothetical protein ACRC67_14055, partial [Inquilinus sp.]|uniref:hypothetical protein n=1 Tax=Inquilinus sp. TaxID=1932117 RepID=UPI003F2C1480
MAVATARETSAACKGRLRLRPLGAGYYGIKRFLSLAALARRQGRLLTEAVWKGVFGERGPGFVDVLLSKRVRQLRYQVRIAWSRPGTPRME